MSVAPSEIFPERVRPLRRTEYESMVRLGHFEDERIELLRGVIVELSPQAPPHASVVQRLTRLFAAALPPERAGLRLHSPFALSDDSEPEPDVALVPPGDYQEGHPTAAFLLVEVADSSLRKDRELKAGLYAAGGVPEYWVVDLRHRVVEVHTEPIEGRYARVTPVRGGETIRLVALPDVVVSVAEFLP